MSTLTRRPLRAAGRVVAVLLGLAPAASVMAQAAPSYDTLLERLDQLPGTRVGAALAEAADARGTAVDARLSRVAAEIDLARLEGRAPFVEVP